MIDSLQVAESKARIVIDAVGFVRSLINPHSAWGAILFEYSPSFVLLMSDELEFEINDVLKRPALLRKFEHLSDTVMRELLAIIDNAERVVLTEIPPVCRDLNDDKVIATAVQGIADFIATEDKDLLDMRSYQGIRIVTGPQLLQHIHGQQ